MRKNIIAWFLKCAALLTVAFGVFILYKYEYITQFSQIDNIIGMLPVTFVTVFVVSAVYLLLAKHTRKNIALVFLASTGVIASVLLMPLALRGNWWLGLKIYSEVAAAPDLSVYEPFTAGSQSARLSGKSTLQLTESLPRLDGATALYPVYAAFAQEAYSEKAYTKDTVVCTNTSGAYKSVIAGDCDIVFVAGASQKQIEAAESAGVSLCFTPIGREAFVFVAGKENPVNDISISQIRNIYSGKTAYWSTLGWNEGGKILAYQRPEGSGSQTGLQAVMDGLPIQAPQPLPSPDIMQSVSLMKQISVKWRGVQPALGYSYKYYATTMYANPDTKLLSVNGVAPTAKNIQNGSYPFTNNFYAVTNGEPQGNEKLLIEWILSPQGQELIEKTGYASIID